MKLSISNIAWTKDKDRFMYRKIRGMGYSALEIAPTRIFGAAPYEDLALARQWAQALEWNYGLAISSIQSIWNGRKEFLFGTEEEREILLGYTKKAINFAVAVGGHNLVFGCPQNRVMLDKGDFNDGIRFFKEIGDYAAEKGIAIGLEANPPIYNTNYINTTRSAIELIQTVNSKGFKLNLDVGAMIYNDENLDALGGGINLINHVHISEPGLKLIRQRTLHRELAKVLKVSGYDGFVSVEMRMQKNPAFIEEAAVYVKEVFHDI